MITNTILFYVEAHMLIEDKIDNTVKPEVVGEYCKKSCTYYNYIVDYCDGFNATLVEETTEVVTDDCEIIYTLKHFRCTECLKKDS